MTRGWFRGWLRVQHGVGPGGGTGWARVVARGWLRVQHGVGPGGGTGWARVVARGWLRVQHGVGPGGGTGWARWWHKVSSTSCAFQNRFARWGPRADMGFASVVSESKLLAPRHQQPVPHGPALPIVPAGVAVVHQMVRGL